MNAPRDSFDRYVVINALGVLDNPNVAPLDAPQGGSYTEAVGCVDFRALDDAIASGLTAVNVTLGHVAGEGDAFELTVRDIARWNARIRLHSRVLARVDGAADFERLKAQGRVGVIYGVQNTTMLGNDTDRVELFSNLGVRVMQLTYNGTNRLGDGATVAEDKGLSLLGAEMVHRMQHEGVLLDLSHSSEKTCLHALRMARRPAAITHSGCRAVADHPRNKSDAELRLLADKGGVIGIYFMPYLRAEGQPLAADMLAHLEHALDVCGEDHVGIGTDGGITHHDDLAAFRRRLAEDVETRRRLGIGAPGETADVCVFLPDLCGVDQFRRLADLLAERGHPDARIAKILGGNFRRVMADAWNSPVAA